MKKVSITVNGMTCEHCKRAVEEGLKKLEGVKEVEVNLQEKLATLTYDETRITMDDIYNEIKEIGYEPVIK